jgi:hypothetical protein
MIAFGAMVMMHAVAETVPFIREEVVVMMVTIATV